MPGTTTYYELVTYGTEDDTFLNFRTAIAGPTASNSNMEKIGNGLHAHDISIASLQNTRGALAVAATYVSPGYYEGTNSLITAYVADMTIALKLSSTSSGTTTLKIGALATKSLMKINTAGTAVNLTGNDLVAGRYYLFRFDSVADCWVWIDQISTGEDGWTWGGETWTYASSTTFTIAGDRTTIFTAGLKLKLTQSSTVKYYYVLSSSYSAPSTTVTICGDTLANAAISSNYYSREETPLGFPDTFSFSTTWATTGTSPALNDGTLTSKFKLRGKMCFLVLRLVFGSTTSAGTGTWSFSLPIAAAVATHTYAGVALARDAGTANYPLQPQINAGNSTLATFIALNYGTNINSLSNTVPITWGSGDTLQLQIEYEIP